MWAGLHANVTHRESAPRTLRNPVLHTHQLLVQCQQQVHQLYDAMQRTHAFILTDAAVHTLMLINVRRDDEPINSCSRAHTNSSRSCSIPSTYVARAANRRYVHGPCRVAAAHRHRGCGGVAAAAACAVGGGADAGGAPAQERGLARHPCSWRLGAPGAVQPDPRGPAGS